MLKVTRAMLKYVPRPDLRRFRRWSACRWGSAGFSCPYHARSFDTPHLLVHQLFFIQIDICYTSIRLADMCPHSNFCCLTVFLVLSFTLTISARLTWVTPPAAGSRYSSAIPSAFSSATSVTVSGRAFARAFGRTFAAWRDTRPPPRPPPAARLNI